MTHSAQFDLLCKHENKYFTSPEDYLVPGVISGDVNSIHFEDEVENAQDIKSTEFNKFSIHNLAAFQDLKDDIPPFNTSWSLFTENELENFLQLATGHERREAVCKTKCL